jgi:hypothetical protein
LPEKRAPSKNTCNRMGSSRFPWKYLLEMRFRKNNLPVNFISNSYSHGKLGEPILLHVFPMGNFFSQLILKKELIAN